MKTGRLVNKLPVSDSKKRDLSSAVIDDGTKTRLVFVFFDVMKSDASPLVPRLAPFINDTYLRSHRAIHALANVGSNAWPVFKEALVATNFPKRESVLSAISLAHYRQLADWSIAVPLMRQCADDNDEFVAMSAIGALGLMKLDPETFVPFLTNKFQSPVPRIRMAAITALAYFGSSAVSAVPSIETALSDTDPDVCWAATNALETIRSQVATNSPAR